MIKNYDFSELKRLIDLNSYTKNKLGVDENGKIFTKWMQALGFSCEVHKRDEVGNHLLFTSKQTEGKKVLLLGHLDTVFPPMSFEHYRDDDEWIYGPGVCDMKGGNMVALESLRNLHQIFGEIRDIDMLLVSDEETGSDDSKDLTLSLAKNYDYCLVYEAAGKNGEVVNGRKGVGTFFIDIEGKASHAGNEYIKGINANLEAAHKLIALTALTDLEKGTTVNVGKVEGGIGANTISPHAKLSVELRYTNSDERDRVLRGFESICQASHVEGSVAKLSGGIQRDVMAPNVKQEAFLEKIEALTGEKITVEQRGGVSDANHMASQGVITLDGFGPFGDGDHTIAERASKKSYFGRIDLNTKILTAFMENKI
ncbi:MAG: M20 family metallopeptidase [Epsilonproteobacteria bacterium]|nr:M20 family metallopeptidase [Campylobacterota bacterium]